MWWWSSAEPDVRWSSAEPDVRWSSADFSRPCKKNGYYDVFLSFRGVDTRSGFTSYLYHRLMENKIYTFMDVNIHGEDFNCLLEVEKSRMAVVIYSESFASSEWCLRELELILQRREEKKMLMIPIFYKVDVHELKCISERTAMYLDKHTKMHNETTVKKWKNVILRLGQISGLSFKDMHHRSEYSFIDEVITRIKRKLGEFEEIQENWAIKPNSKDIRNQDDNMESSMELKGKGKLLDIKPSRPIYKEDCGDDSEDECQHDCEDASVEGVTSSAQEDTHLVGMEDQEEEVIRRGASKLIMDTNSIGMTDQVKEVMRLLDVESGGMFIVGIHGISGVGKTTLAKAVFDQLSSYFQICCFIRDIRQKLKSKGIQYSQDILLSKILCTNKDDEMETMKDKLFNKKILIVLDDIDQKEQINDLVGRFSWFGSGSRIIITTRNKNVMPIEHQRSVSSAMEWPKFEAFEMRQMNHDLALQLFNRHALGEDSSSSVHRIICEDIVKATGRLPLELEILGSYLRRAGQCESTLKKLKDVSHLDIEEILKISYEALKHETQQIFLDIACFFCNKELSFPVYMWDACGYFPNQSIEVLRLLSLIKIIDDNKLWMHDLVRDFGRKIVRENAMDPANRSRLWVHEEVLYILEEIEKPKGQTEAIGVHGHGFPWGLILSRKELEAFPSLRYLELCRFQFVGNLAGTLSNLKWLSWNFCPPDFEAINLHLESLVILDLSRSHITHQWGGWAQITMANLEVLNLSCCKYLVSTPDFSGYKKLESLILEDCVSLATIGTTIGELEQLKYLNLKGCISLSNLPDELFGAKRLEKILVSGKGQSFDVPEWIGGLTQLLILEIANVKTTAIPSDIGKLKSLVRLDLSGADVTELPVSFGNMMEALTVIKLDASSIRRLPSSIGKLTSLEELYCRNCEDLQEIPVEIGELYSLRILDLSFTGISHLPETISELCLLQTLTLEPCNKLLALPYQLPESLINMAVVSKKLMSIPDLSSLKSVIHLKLTTGYESSSFNLNWVGKLHQLKTLQLCFPLIAGLEFAAMTELYSLSLSSKYLEGFSQLPSSLSRLFLAHLNVKTAITKLSELKNLTFLELRGLSVKEDKGEIGFAELESVEHLSVHNCNFNSLPKKLRAVYISKCKFPQDVLDLTGLHHLVHLEIKDCESLIHVRGVSGLESLEEINIYDCESLETVDSLLNLNHLEALTLDSCRKLREVKGLNQAVDSLKQFEIYDCNSLEEQPWSPRSLDGNEEN